MIKIVIPPTTLASNLISTLIVYSMSAESRASIRKGDYGELIVTIDINPSEFLRGFHLALKENLVPREPIAKIPLIPGGSGTDGWTLMRIFGSKVSLQASRARALYDGLLNIVLQELGRGAMNQLARLRIDVENGVLRLCMGSCEYSVPVIVKSEAFYELGRFGGTSDRTAKGQP
ncbi:MAG TPA: hypothetical protein EYP20_04650, partial [Aigarchaeota archaeon]|nr:hypothetical protein [Aigarchaeota archaeon]